MKTHAPSIAERTAHPLQRGPASRNSRQGGQISQLRAMIERSPAMLAQRRACATIQREQSDAKPQRDGAKLLRTEHLLAALQQKHSDHLLEQFAAGTVPDALSASASLGVAWSAYAGILADAVCEPAGALAHAAEGLGDSEQAGAAAAIGDSLAALAMRIKGMGRLADPSAIAAAAAEVQREIARLCQLFAAKVAGKCSKRGGDEAWDSIKKPSTGMPPAPEADTTAPPAKDAKPADQVSGS